MNNYLLKLKHIVLTFIKVSVCTSLFYLIIYGLFCVVLEIPLTDNFTDYYFPIALSALSTILWIRPKLKLLTFSKKSQALSYYYMICLGFMSWLMIGSASWMVIVTNPLILVNGIEELENSGNNRFYGIKTYKILNQNSTSSYAVSRARAGKSRRRNYYYMNLYLAAPFALKRKTASAESHKYWILNEFYHTESSLLEDSVRNKNFAQYIETTTQEYESDADLYSTKYFAKVMPSKEKTMALQAIRKVMPTPEKNIVLLKPLWGHPHGNKKNLLTQVLLSFLGGIGILMILLLFPGINPEKKVWKLDIRKHFRALIASFSSSK